MAYSGKLTVALALIGVLAARPVLGMCAQTPINMDSSSSSDLEVRRSSAVPCCTAGATGGTICIEVVHLAPMDMLHSHESIVEFSNLADDVRHADDGDDPEPFPFPVPGVGKESHQLIWPGGTHTMRFLHPGLRRGLEHRIVPVPRISAGPAGGTVSVEVVFTRAQYTGRNSQPVPGIVNPFADAYRPNG